MTPELEAEVRQSMLDHVAGGGKLGTGWRVLYSLASGRWEPNRYGVSHGVCALSCLLLKRQEAAAEPSLSVADDPTTDARIAIARSTGMTGEQIDAFVGAFDGAFSYCPPTSPRLPWHEAGVRLRQEFVSGPKRAAQLAELRP